MSNSADRLTSKTPAKFSSSVIALCCKVQEARALCQLDQEQCAVCPQEANLEANILDACNASVEVLGRKDVVEDSRPVEHEPQLSNAIGALCFHLASDHGYTDLRLLLLYSVLLAAAQKLHQFVKSHFGLRA